MPNRHLKFKSLLAVLLVVPVVGAANTEEQLIERTYEAWEEAANEKDISKWSSFLAEDPYFSPADSPPLTSRAAILDYYQKLFSDPAFSLECEQLEVHVSRSGDMAWSRGVCNGTSTGADGNKVNGSSRWLKVWARQPDGSWRGQVNSWKFEN